MTTRTQFTICLAYYMNPGMLCEWYKHLARLGSDLKANMNLIVVDDGSPKGPAFPPVNCLGVPVSIYRMKIDIPWNQDACRNLAASRADTPWLLLTDMDHLPSEELLRYLIYHKMDPRVAYTFTRVTAPNLTPYKPHPNSYFMTKDLYFESGGYDERYAGIYGTDGEFKRRVQQTAVLMKQLDEPLIRYPREVIADASTTTLPRKSEQNDDRKIWKRVEIKRSGDPTPQHFLTPWERVA